MIVGIFSKRETVAIDHCKEHSIRGVNETKVCLLKRSKRRDDDGTRMKNETEVNGSK